MKERKKKKIRVSTMLKVAKKSRSNKNGSQFQTSFNVFSYFPREIMQ